MLVGTCPFKGSNEVDLLNNIKNRNLVIPNEVEISSLSLDVLSKLLERVPDKRATVAQLMVLKSHLPRLSSSAAMTHGSPEEPSSRPRSASRPTVQEEEEEAASHPSQSSTHAQPQSSATGGPILVSQQARTQQMALGNLNPSTATAATTLSMSPPGISYRPQNPNASPNSINATGFYDSMYSQPIVHSSQKHHSGSGKGISPAESSASGRRHSTDSALSPSYSHSNNSSSTTGIISNLGKAINFMMYSPSHRGPANNNSGVNLATVNPRSHVINSGKHSPPHAHQGNSYEKRSSSLDRGVPPSFAPSGAQSASGRTRQHSSAIPLHHQQPTSFYPEDSYSSGRQYAREGFDNFGMPLHSVSPSHANLSSNRKEISQADAEDDFVFIPSSSSGSSSNSGLVGGNTNQALHQDPTVVSDPPEIHSSSSSSTSFPNPYHHGGNLQPLNRQTTQNSQLFQIDELSPPSTSLFLSNVTQRCHITCKIVHEITSLGDEFIQKAINSEYVERNSTSPKQATTAMIARGGSFRRRSNSGSLVLTPAAIVDNYLLAISLYFHALNILKNLMGSITEGTVTGPRTSTEEMISKIREVSYRQITFLECEFLFVLIVIS